MQGPQQTDLIKLKYSKQNIQLTQIKKQLSQYPKYFFHQRQNIVIIYDKTKIYVIKRDQTKVYDLGQQYLISDLAYNHQRQILIFLTVQGQLFLYFLNKKTHFIIKKDIKKNICFNWVFSVSNIFQFFISDESGVKLYKVQEEKKSFKQVKNLSGKYNSFLYEPLTETLVGFPIGDCKQIHTFIFNQSKYSNWFKSNPVHINFDNDQILLQKAKKQKSLGLDWQKNTKQIFTKNINQNYFVKLFKINKKCQLIFFFTEQGLLRITSISEDKERQINIKLPSDSIPQFNILDDMVVVHLKVEGITFIYDLNGNVLQPLVSPYPLRHRDEKEALNIYDSAFVGERVIHPNGIISKWLIQHSVIFSYLKNQLQIFDFFIKRKQAKMELLKWIRRDLFKIKQVNLSKFWKSLFLKYLSGVYPQNQVINLVDLHSNIFYTLSSEELIPKQRFLNIILQCVRQSLQLKMSIPLQVQNLIFTLLLEFKKYDTLIYLSHNEVIKDNEQYIKILLKQYSKTNDMIIETLAIDMTFRSGSCKEMIKLLMKFSRVREAKKHIKLNYQKIQALYLIEVAKYIKSPPILQDYLKWIRSFILIKYPTMNVSYINEAQQKLFNPESKNRVSQLPENLFG